MSRDFAATAQQTYKNLKKYFEGSGNFWQLGNAFDTATDYLRMAWDTYPDTHFAVTAYNKYNNTGHTSAACWYDDYGWWGIACAKAFDSRFTEILAGGASQVNYIELFQRAAVDCWNVMNNGKGDGVHLGAPNVWSNKDNISKFTTPPQPPTPSGYWHSDAPLVGNGVGSGVHGTWQYDLFYNERNAPNWTGPTECNDATNPSDPNLYPVKLGPYQLTVMNGLFMVLAARLQMAGIPGVQQPMQDEYGFLRAWFGLDPRYSIDPKYLLLYNFDNNRALIRERVGIYAEYMGTNKEVEHWDTETCWGGDAGLILGGLTDYLAIHPGDPLTPIIVRSIASGVATYMADSTGLQPWYPIQGNKLKGWDPGDYKCGSGVFMRYLLQSYQRPNSPLISLVKTPQFQQFLCNAAVAACDAPQNDLFDSLNVLATLTAAMQMLDDVAGCQVG